MRILHTSDWHLGRRLHGVDLTDDHRAFIDWLHQLVVERGVRVLIIAGDVFDRAIPHPDALALWEHAVSGFLDRNVRIVATSGNHDSFVRLGLNRRHLDRAGVHLRTHISDIDRPVRLSLDGEIKASDDDSPGVAIYGIPYLEPSLVWQRMRARERSHEAVLTAAMSRITSHRAVHSPQDLTVVLAHAFVAGSTSSESERDVSLGGVGVTPAAVFDGADYVALGHLHRPQELSPTVRYSGSPLPFSFGEARFDKHALEVDFLPEAMNSHDRQLSVTPHIVPQFRAVRTLRGSLQNILASAPDHTNALISAELTDEQRVPGAVDRLRAAFPGFIRLVWTSLQSAEALGSASRSGGVQPTDTEVFHDFHQAQRGTPPPAHARERFESALARVHMHADSGKAED